MEIKLKPGERIDDLQAEAPSGGTLKIIQHKDKYCFNTDSCILANFAKVKRGEKVLDIGGGSGIISILLTGKYKAGGIVCVEIQEYFAEMSRRSVELNNLSDKITVEYTDIRGFHKTYGLHGFDAVVSNPPYNARPVPARENPAPRVSGNEMISSDYETAICSHELTLSLRELIEACERNVKYGGRVYLVHQAERIPEIFAEMYAVKLEPKRMRLVQGKASAKPTLVLLEAHNNGAKGLVCENNLILYNDDGTETEELKKIYGRRSE